MTEAPFTPPPLEDAADTSVPARGTLPGPYHRSSCRPHFPWPAPSPDPGFPVVPVVLDHSIFCPTKGYLTLAGDVFDCHTWWGGGWHLAGRGQGCDKATVPRTAPTTVIIWLKLSAISRLRRLFGRIKTQLPTVATSLMRLLWWPPSRSSLPPAYLSWDLLGSFYNDPSHSSPLSQCVLLRTTGPDIQRAVSGQVKQVESTSCPPLEKKHSPP